MYVCTFVMGKANEDHRFSTVKSCAASYSCPSAENVCVTNSKRWFTDDDVFYKDSY